MFAVETVLGALPTGPVISLLPRISRRLAEFATRARTSTICRGIGGRFGIFGEAPFFSTILTARSTCAKE